ncbi:hypothetical protein AMECASPLE_009045, partial [Ameca splendens]
MKRNQLRYQKGKCGPPQVWFFFGTIITRCLKMPRSPVQTVTDPKSKGKDLVNIWAEAGKKVSLSTMNRVNDLKHETQLFTKWLNDHNLLFGSDYNKAPEPIPIENLPAEFIRYVCVSRA